MSALDNILRQRGQILKQREFEQTRPVQRRSEQLNIQSQDLGVQRQQQQLRAGEQQQQITQQEQADFLEKKNLTSMVEGALKFESITDPGQKEQFLVQRAAEIEQAGRNPKDTSELLDILRTQGPDAADDAAANIIAIGERFNVIKPGAQPRQKKQPKLIQGVGPDGKPAFFQQDEATGELKPVKGAVPAKKGPLVSVTTGGDKEERKKIAGVQAKRFETIVNKGQDARDALDNINQLQTIDIETGALLPAKAAFAAVMKDLGFADAANSIANVTNAQALRAVSNRMVNNVLNAAKGPQTEGDARRARQTIQSLGDDPKAGEFKTNALKSLALRQIEQADFVEQRIDQGKTFTQANKEWNQFKRETPSLSETIKGPDGLPLFFFQFKENAISIRPDITDEEITGAWRSAN